jgi:hypothetical protein
MLLQGATKCWGEALCRVYSNSRSLACIAVRLTSPADSSGAQSPQRVGDFFGRCVDAGPELTFCLANELDIAEERELHAGYAAPARL